MMTVVIVGHKSFVAMVMFRIAGMNIETVRSVATSLPESNVRARFAKLPAAPQADLFAGEVARA